MANFNFNKVIVGGRVASDVELKTTPSGTSVTSFSIAVTRKYKQGEEAQADFFTVTAWRNTAEFISKYFKKGSSIAIEGSLQTRSWTDQNGSKRYATEIVAENVFFVDSKNEKGSNDQPSAQTYNTYVPEASATISSPKFEEITDDDELPF